MSLIKPSGSGYSLYPSKTFDGMPLLSLMQDPQHPAGRPIYCCYSILSSKKQTWSGCYRPTL